MKKFLISACMVLALSSGAVESFDALRKEAAAFDERDVELQGKTGKDLDRSDFNTAFHGPGWSHFFSVRHEVASEILATAGNDKAGCALLKVYVSECRKDSVALNKTKKKFMNIVSGKRLSNDWEKKSEGFAKATNKDGEALAQRWEKIKAKLKISGKTPVAEEEKTAGDDSGKESERRGNEKEVKATGMSPRDFRAQKPKKPVFFYAAITHADFYSHQYENAQRTHLSIGAKLYPDEKFDEWDIDLYAYCERSTPLGKKLSALLKDGQKHFGLISISYPELEDDRADSVVDCFDFVEMKPTSKSR